MISPDVVEAIRTCTDYSDGPTCCVSCHDDANEYWPQYPLCEIHVNGKLVAEVCCAKASYVRTEELKHLADRSVKTDGSEEGK